MKRKVEKRSGKKSYIPKGDLDTLHVVFLPVLLCDFFLANRHTVPRHPHDGDMVNVVLVKFNREGREVRRRPLGKSPLLNNFFVLFKLNVLA